MEPEAVFHIYLANCQVGRYLLYLSLYAMLRVHETVRKEPHCFIISSLESFLIYIHEECL